MAFLDPLQRPIEGVILIAADNVGGHYFADAMSANGEAIAAHVIEQELFGEDAGNPSVLNDRHWAEIERLHLLGGVAQRVVWRYVSDHRDHDVLYLHRGLPRWPSPHDRTSGRSRDHDHSRDCYRVGPGTGLLSAGT